MATSLAEQLRRLAAPQTSILVDSKKRASIIFNPKEAATKDRKTIYDLGYSALIELIAVNPSFGQFEQTLFQSTTLHMERAVESAKVNEQLNSDIRKFLQHLSPYFMLRPAHMCIEWLIRRFHIHEFNKEDFLSLILPYHETKIFVRCVQILGFHNPNDQWKWLQPIQKSGVPLSKMVILNRAASDNYFLKFVCQTTLDAIKELDSKAHILQAKINFYCMVVVGGLENAQKISEAHITNILPSVLKGFSSATIDFVAAAFMITAQLVTKTTITEKLLKVLIEKICCVSFDNMQADKILLLMTIIKTQKSSEFQFPASLLIDIVSIKGITKTIGSLCSQSISIGALCNPLVGGCIKAIQEQQDDWIAARSFLENILSDIHFPSNDAKDIIIIVIKNYAHRESKKIVGDSDVIELDSDNDESMDFHTWYSGYLQTLERQYPSEFDIAMKDVMQDIEDSTSRKQSLKIILSFRLKGFHNEPNTAVYENLYHHIPRNRVEAVQFLVTNFEKLSCAQNTELLKESLSDRLKDDNSKVVAEVLKLSTSKLIEILGGSYLTDSLISIINKGQSEPDEWLHVFPSVLKHLTKKETLNGQCPQRILLNLMPFLFPIVPTDVSIELAKIIFKSDVIYVLQFLKVLAHSQKNCTNVKELNKEFIRAVSTGEGTPTVQNIINYIETEQAIKESTSSSFSYTLLLITLCLKSATPVNISLHVFEVVMKYLKSYEISSFDNRSWVLACQKQTVPLKLFLDFLITLIANTAFDSKFSVKVVSNSAVFIVKTYEFLVIKAFTSEPQERNDYVEALKSFMEKVFPSANEKLTFLSIFFSYDSIFNIKLAIDVRIRSVMLFNLAMQGRDRNYKIGPELFVNILISLSSDISIIREITLETLKIIADIECEIANEKCKMIACNIVSKSEEILMDSEQIALVLYTIIGPQKKSKKSDLTTSVLNEILDILCDADTDSLLKSKMLSLLKHVNNADILTRLASTGINALNCYKSEKGIDILETPHADIFELIVSRFDEHTMDVVGKDSNCWLLIEKALQFNKTLMVANGKLVPVSSLVIDQFDEDIYKRLPNKFKDIFLKLVVNAIASSENSYLFLCGNKMLKRCVIDCKNMINILNEMIAKSNSVATHTKYNASPSLDVLNSAEWKYGITLLELLENMKNIENAHVLIPTLFDILKKCLSFEEQVSLEYPKQLILSSILHCCNKNQNKSKISESVFRIDMIVQCVRATQNPQTHHHALLLLSHCAGVYPQQVLHNIMDIFTFMGSSVVRHEDAFSFQIISNIMESVIPTLVQRQDEKSENLVIPVFKVFADIILDVPEHRRLPLYIKLLNTLDANRFLWMFVCVVFESHVIHDGKDKLEKSKSMIQNRSEETPKRTDICLQLTKSFSTKIMLSTCISLLEYLKTLPETNSVDTKNKMEVDVTDTKLFDLEARSSKQLRHYKYIILQFISSLTSSPEFIGAIVLLDNDDAKSMKTYYQNFIIKILSYIPDVIAPIEKSRDASQVKFWKVILHHCYDILENAISLLTPDMFLVVVHGLMQHQMLTVRKKVLELLINKLQHKIDYFTGCNEENLLNLLTPLTEIIDLILEKDKSSGDLSYIQQSALIGVKLLSKLIGLKYIDHFKNVINKLTVILKKRDGISRIIFATVILSTIEISSNLKAHSISHLPKIMPHILQVLQEQAELAQSQSPDNVCIAVVTGVQKLFEAVPLFLGPYILDIVCSLSILWVHISRQSGTNDQRSTIVLNKLSQIWAKISNEVPSRILVPSCAKAYCRLMEMEIYSGVTIIMNLLTECFQSAKFDMNSVQIELTNLFLKMLEFRTILKEYKDQAEVNVIEGTIVDTVVAWVLKLSESSFRPLYHKIYDWGIRDASNKEKAITYFVLSSKIAGALKSLFVLFAGDFVQDASNLLNNCNPNKTNTLYFEDSPEKNTILAKYIIKTLYQVFLYDNARFINPHRFDIVMQSIVDQLENNLIMDEPGTAAELLGCLSQLAVAVSNDVLWKQLNYQVLLKTRSNKPEYRITAFNCCVEIAKKLGEDFNPLLPETIPFIAELLEDEHSKVESNCRTGVQELEKVLGESLQKYL